MKYTTKRRIVQLAAVRLQVLVVLSLLGLALLGRTPESTAGWITCPPRVVMVVARKRRRRSRRRECDRSGGRRAGWRHLLHSGYVPLLRSAALWELWLASGRAGPVWLGLVPWGLWVWQGAGMLWPRLRGQPEWQGGRWLLWQGQRLLLVGYLGLAGRALLHIAATASRPPVAVLGDGHAPWPLGLGCVVCESAKPRVEVVQGERGGYTATLCGHFTVRVGADDPFRVRMLMLFLRSLEVEGPQRRGRRTRDGRTPFVSQQKLAAWFRMPQPDISRIEGYWLEGDWANLLSLKAAEVLTQELIGRIVEVSATFPWWGTKKVYRHLQEQGMAVTERQVRQAREQSGWHQVRQALRERYHLTEESIRPRDEWVARQLLSLVEILLGKLEAGAGLTTEERMSVADLQKLAAEGEVAVRPPLKALPWMMRVEQVLFGRWEMIADDKERCIYCGSTQVGRKSKKPRWKKYYDEEGKLQRVAVYRYYCRNQDCEKGSFTNLPAGLVPYSRYRTETKLLAVQMYAWGYSTYRRTGRAVGVASMTAYRWVRAWGYELLPVAALFGVVRSSGVVGVDEKYVLVPKNDKPAGKMRRWMYVYLAVDVYTYDLLHIAIYPHNNKQSCRAFLLALRAKGYHPQVIVTDLRQDYGAEVRRVFPTAKHHECIFHALQNVQKRVKEVYGDDYAQNHPEAEALKRAIYHIFEARTKRTAQKRYREVLAQRARYVRETPEAATIFDFLERHWSTLLNGIESKLIPRTNNTVELVIRRFDQHYQNFCGFESLESAQLFLGVFEKVYRFTPFSPDAQPRIRDKCPLELAGYDISQVPMAPLCAGLSVIWPTEVAQNHVPSL